MSLSNDKYIFLYQIFRERYVQASTNHITRNYLPFLTSGNTSKKQHGSENHHSYSLTLKPHIKLYISTRSRWYRQIMALAGENVQKQPLEVFFKKRFAGFSLQLY